MLSVNNKTKKKAPKGPFSDIADYILGQDYELSLVFIGDALSKKLNQQHRGKDYVANVLSFPLEEKAGEIFIDLVQVSREYKKFNEFFPQITASVSRYTAFLFIHGCLHLNGMDHSDKMESEEQRVFKRFFHN